MVTCKAVRYFLMMVLCLICSCQDGERQFLEDPGGLLSRFEKQNVVDYHELLLVELDIHFKLIILDSASVDIDGEAAALFGELGAGTDGARGLLYLVDPIGKQVRIEVGYDLEHVFTDGFTGFVEEKQMVPFFEHAKVGAGILAATELFVSRIQQAADGNEPEFDEKRAEPRYYSGGGGARTAMALGSKVSDEKPVSAISYSAQSTPEQTLQEYMKVLAAGEKDPNLGLFTPETRTFFSKWLVTDAQQQNELRTLGQAVPERVIISDDRAVIRFPVDRRNQAPYFLERGPDGWMLDFWTMTNVIRMNHRNLWFFSRRNHPYTFGFSDWYLDENGFPHQAE